MGEAGVEQYGQNSGRHAGPLQLFSRGYAYGSMLSWQTTSEIAFAGR